MKRLLSVFLFFLLIASDAVTQTLTRIQSWGLDFESITWRNNQEGIVVGERLIARTSDGGTTWEEVLQKFDTRFYDVVFVGENKAVAVGESGAIYLTGDGGRSWQKKESGTQSTLLSIAKLSDSLLFAVGEKGEIVSSTDSGETWKKISSGTSLRLNEITFSNENTGFIAADGGKILKSTDKGATWTLSGLDQSDALYGIAFSSESTGYAVGENGLFVKTVDSGSTWTVLNSATTNTLRKVAISPLDARIVTAAGDLATVVRTANSGTSFTKRSLGAGNIRNLKSIAFIPGSNLASTIGQDGYLSNSGNAGTSWTQKLAGIRNNFTSADFKNLNTGYIAGERGGLFVTTNGATTLVNRSLPESILIHTIDFWNTSFGYAGSQSGKIYRTSNSGTVWTPVFNPADRSVTGFYLFAPSTVYLTGSQGYISRSSDSGVTWDQTVVSNTTENLKDLTFFDNDNGFAVGDSGQISWTFGGNMWETIPKVTEQNLNALAKIDTSQAIVVGDGGIILKTNDKAKTWKKIESGTDKDLKSVDFFGKNNGFVAGEDGLAMVTVDGGETWRPIVTGTLRSLNAVSAGTDQKAYFVGEDGTILSFICSPPTGSLGEIMGDSQSCLVNTSYSVSGLPQAGSTIAWRVDGGEIISGQGTSQIEVKWTTAGRNAVLVSRSNFCGTGETSAKEVQVTSLPPVNVSIEGEGAVCQEVPYTYSLSNIEGVTYAWTISDGQITKGQGTHVVEVLWNQEGTQQITVKQENYCGATESIVKAITVNSAPQAPLSIAGEARVGLGEQTYEIESNPGLNYRWTVSGEGGKILSGQGTGRLVVVWEKEGDFELSVEAQNECGFSTKRTLAVNVNIITALEPLGEGNLKIYPNPSSGNLTITSTSLDSWASLSVFNSLGQLVETLPIASGQGEIYLQGLPKGLLVVKLEGKNGVLSKKVLVR